MNEPQNLYLCGDSIKIALFSNVTYVLIRFYQANMSGANHTSRAVCPSWYVQDSHHRLTSQISPKIWTQQTGSACLLMGTAG